MFRKVRLFLRLKLWKLMEIEAEIVIESPSMLPTVIF
jgi:hypothetical protein